MKAGSATGGTTHSGKTLIVGLGRTGLSCARYLNRLGVQAAVIDSRAEPPGLAQLNAELPDVATFVGAFDEAVFAQAERLIVSPGVALTTPQIAAARARGVEVIGDIELFVRAAQAPLAVITGSNGKSTVTSLLGAMALRAGRDAGIGGNLGEPALDLLADGRDLYVLELSSFQLETTPGLRADVAAVLNVSADHMDRYPDLTAYAATKARVFDHARVGVRNLDDPRVRAMSGADHFVGFGLAAPASEDDYGILQVDGESWLARGSETVLPTAALRVPGEHNRANALAALAMADALGLERAVSIDVLGSFPGLPHRTEWVGERRGVAFYNDSKGTNPGACVAALSGLHDPVSAARTVLIAGGDAKGANFESLAPVLATCARALVMLGRDAPAIAAVAPAGLPIYQAGDMAEAVELAAAAARPGDRVLLSPACASQDMYANYEARGDEFRRVVEELCL